MTHHVVHASLPTGRSHKDRAGTRPSVDCYRATKWSSSVHSNPQDPSWHATSYIHHYRQDGATTTVLVQRSSMFSCRYKSPRVVANNVWHVLTPTGRQRPCYCEYEPISMLLHWYLCVCFCYIIHLGFEFSISIVCVLLLVGPWMLLLVCSFFVSYCWLLLLYLYILFILLFWLLYLLFVDGVLPTAGAVNMLVLLLIDISIETSMCTFCSLLLTVLESMWLRVLIDVGVDSSLCILLCQEMWILLVLYLKMLYIADVVYHVILMFYCLLMVFYLLPELQICCCCFWLILQLIRQCVRLFIVIVGIGIDVAVAIDWFSCLSCDVNVACIILEDAVLLLVRPCMLLLVFLLLLLLCHSSYCWDFSI